MDKTAKDLLEWIKSWTPEQAKEFHELAEAIKNASARVQPPKWAIELSGACKLHYHEDCGYPKCQCICHKIERAIEHYDGCYNIFDDTDIVRILKDLLK